MDITPIRTIVEGARTSVDHLVESGFLEHGEDWIKAWYRYDLKWSGADPAYVTLCEHNIGHFVDEARTNRKVFELAQFVASSRREAGVSLPPVLDVFETDVRAGNLKRPHGSSGRTRNWGRDFIIINVMSFLCLGDPDSPEPGRFPTANLDQRGVRERDHSASEILFHALPMTKVGGVSWKTIQTVWSNRGKQAAHDEAYSLYLGGLLDDLDNVERM